MRGNEEVGAWLDFEDRIEGSGEHVNDAHIAIKSVEGKKYGGKEVWRERMV